MMTESDMKRKVRCHTVGCGKFQEIRIVASLLAWRRTHESENPTGCGVVESHLSQRTRKMGHPAFSNYLQSTLLSCAAATCHLASRFNQMSVQTWHCFASGCVLSLPMACSLP
jgi:hypothetical protein